MRKTRRGGYTGQSYQFALTVSACCTGLLGAVRDDEGREKPYRLVVAVCWDWYEGRKHVEKDTRMLYRSAVTGYNNKLFNPRLVEKNPIPHKALIGPKKATKADKGLAKRTRSSSVDGASRERAMRGRRNATNPQSKKRKKSTSIFPDPDTLRKLGIYDEVKEILRNMGIDDTLRMRYCAYKEETCQFLATLEVILDESGSQRVQRTRGGRIQFKGYNGRDTLLPSAL
ncbi:unnamed protein product [Cochlearia groenlandica]